MKEREVKEMDRRIRNLIRKIETKLTEMERPRQVRHSTIPPRVRHSTVPPRRH